MARPALVKVSTIVPESTVPGTKAWAETLVDNAKAYARFAEDDVRPLVERYQALCEHRVWETWFRDEPRTLPRFCREVLGYEAEFLETMSAGVAALDREGFSGPVSVQAAHDAVRAQVHAREARAEALTATDQVPLPERGDVGNGRSRSDVIRSTFGTSESYLRRRLKRDHPALYEQVDSGSLTAGAAAIKAGIRHRTASVRTDDVESAARTLRQHYTDPGQRQALAELLTKEEED